MVRQIDLEVGMYNFVIQNVVASAKLPHLVNLAILRDRLGACASYEPELFPGMVYRPSDTHLVFLIFSSGRIVITGAKHEEQVHVEFKRMKQTFASFGDAIVASSALEGRGCKQRGASLEHVLTHPIVVDGFSLDKKKKNKKKSPNTVALRKRRRTSTSPSGQAGGS